MGSKKEILEKQGQSSRRNQGRDHFADGEKGRSRKNPYALKSVDQQMKRKMQRIVAGEIDEMEDDDLYEDSVYSLKRKKVGMKEPNLGNKKFSRYGELEG